MRSLRTFSVVGCHAEGEVGDVIVGGVLDAPPSCKTMYEKMMYFWTQRDGIRRMLLQEPRGRSSMCANLILPPCDPRADAGLIIMESDEYAPMSGSNTICTATVLLETGMIPMQEPITRFNLDTAAGLVGVTAECEAGKCKSVAFDNVPSFVFALDKAIDVPDLGTVSVDIAWGGMMYALVDAGSCGLTIANPDAYRLIEIGERIKKAVQKQYVPVYPENPGIRGVTNFVWTQPLETGSDGIKEARNTVVVSPGRFDRCPCGTGTCARMAVLHARGQLEVGEIFRHKSIISTEFSNHIRDVTKVGEYDAFSQQSKAEAGSPASSKSCWTRPTRFRRASGLAISGICQPSLDSEYLGSQRPKRSITYHYDAARGNVPSLLKHELLQ
ncbi:proline racemase [Cladophialophora yegresii CBS 114405]|uniref:Proline racemase n=1 Tax=Cladophialophora yegresii CBS 114405 TaxID=1182544 RepID=W9VTB6_9EURO|nr:proline racemase [Cladophialophora yegresii CBS 114405]EXJ58813.1 proline racemase [Cladophialophora yegresii CBS 114405]